MSTNTKTNLNTTVTEPESSNIPLGRLALATLAGAVAAAVVNAIVYWIADAAGSLPNDVLVTTPGGEQAIDLVAVLTMSFIPILVTGVVLAIIDRISRRPFQIFWTISAVALLVSFFSIFGIEDAPGDMIVALMFMHAVAAIVGVGVLSRLARA
jgi:hypothetical protein